MNCDSIREQLEAYALGALTPDESAQVEAHLATCAKCRQLAQEYATIAHALPQALATASPLRLPASLKARVLQQVETPRAKYPHTPIRSSLWAWLRPRNLAFATLIVLLLFALAWGWQLNTALAQERIERALLFGQQEIVLEIIDSPKKVTAFLRPPTGANSTSYGKLYTHPDFTYVVVMAGRLKPPPEGQAYHLWLTSNGQTQLIKTMPVNKDGFGILVFEADRKGPAYDAAQLTLQPMGSTTPQGVAVIQWTR